MRYLHKLVLMVASAAFFIASSQAQNTGTVSNHAVPIGKGPGVSGYTSVAPGATGIPLTSNGAGVDPSFHAVTNAGIAPGAANTVKGSVNGTTTGDLAIASCSLAYQFTQWVTGTGWQCGLNPVLPSRAVALTLNLSAFSVVTTQGYATAGDGGGATFQKQAVGTSFIDQNLANAPCTIAGGSAYTNGTYYGVFLTGGSGALAFAVVTVSGGAVTAVDVTYSAGNKYKVGDVLTAAASSIGGTGSGFTCTVNAIVSAKASFTDTASNPWQYVVDSGGIANTRQFGAKIDGSTDDFASIQSALYFANYTTDLAVGSITGHWGGKVFQPRGASNVCGTTTVSLVVPQGVRFEGEGPYSSILGVCPTFFAATHFIELCNPNWHFACFDARIEAMGLTVTRSQAANANIAMVHSNNVQHTGGLVQVYIQAGNRTCFFYQKGYGGASYVTYEDGECGYNGSNFGIRIGDSTASGMNVSGTVFDMNKMVVGGPATAPLAAQAAFVIQGGLVQIRNSHSEQIPQGIVIDSQGASVASTMVKISNYNAGSGSVTCTATAQINSTNISGNTIMEMVPGGSCTVVVANGLGANVTTNIVQQTKFTPNATTF